MSKCPYILAGQMGGEDVWFFYLRDGNNIVGSYQPERHDVSALYGEDEILETAGHASDGWWFVPRRAGDYVPDAIIWQHQPTKEVVGYALSGTFAHLTSERYPERLTAEEWRAKAGDFDDPIDPSYRAMYEPVSKPKEHERHEQRHFLRLDGEPPPKDGRVWQAKLPYELANHIEYLHLFPGRLLGFTDAVKARLEGLSDLAIDFYTHGSAPSIFVKVPGGNGYAYHNDAYRVPASIEASNRAEAVVEWDRRLDLIEADVRSKCEVCEHCQGTGLPPHKRSPPKARKGRRR